MNIKERSAKSSVILTGLRLTGEKIPLQKMHDDSSSQNTGVMREEYKDTNVLLLAER